MVNEEAVAIMGEIAVSDSDTINDGDLLCTLLRQKKAWE